MSRYNNYYCLMGIDKRQNTAALEDITMAFMVVDYNTGNILYDYHEGAIADFGWIERLRSKPEFKRVTHYRVFPGKNIKQMEIIKFLSMSGLTPREYSDKTHGKDRTLDFGDERWAVSHKTLYDFHIDSTDEEARGSFKEVLTRMSADVGWKILCTRYVSAQKIIKDTIKDFFEPDIAPISSKEIQAEVELRYNKGGNWEASHAGETVPVIGFDVNAMYTSVELTESFSWSREVLMDKHLIKYESREDWLDVVSSMKTYVPGNYETRWIFRVEDAIAIDRNNCCLLCPIIEKSIDSEYGGQIQDSQNKKTLRIHHATVGLLFEDFCHFVEDYRWEKIELLHCCATAIRPLAVRLREHILEKYAEEQEYKKTDPGVASTLKLERNNIPGYLQNINIAYDRDNKACWSKLLQHRDYDRYDKKGRKKHHKASGYMRQPLAGAELTQKGRSLHRYICNLFRDKGLEVVYGNTDSCYVLVDTPEKRDLAISIQKEYNIQNKEFMRKHLGHFEHWKDVENLDVGRLFGGLKIEFEGFIKHNGINRCIKADKDYKIVGASISENICSDDLFRQVSDIRDINIGDVYKLPTRVQNWTDTPHDILWTF